MELYSSNSNSSKINITVVYPMSGFVRVLLDLGATASPFLLKKLRDLIVITSNPQQFSFDLCYLTIRVSLSLALSLAHTHTHRHTYIYFLFHIF